MVDWPAEGVQVSEKKTYEHARPVGKPDEPSVPEPSCAERAKTLVHMSRVGSIATLSRRHPEWPFGSVMPYGLDESGQPTFLISTMAMHTQNVLGDDRASLLVTPPDAAEDPLGAGRVTLLGHVRRTPEDKLSSVRANYLERYENASYWVDFKDFVFFEMELIDLYFVGGFGVMGWVAAEDYLAAEPDPLAELASGIIEHMNEDHQDAMMLLARGMAGIEGEDAKMTAVDRMGFDLRLKTADGMKGFRLPFPREVRDARAAREVLVEMVQKVRQNSQ